MKPSEVMRMVRDGFEAAAWRRALWMALYEVTEAECSITDWSSPAEVICENAINARGYIIEDVRRMQTGRRPLAQWRREVEEIAGMKWNRRQLAPE